MDSETNSIYRADRVSELPSLCRLIFNNSPLPIALAAGAKHIVRYVNPAFCPHCRKLEAELNLKRWFRMFHSAAYRKPNDLPEIRRYAEVNWLQAFNQWLTFAHRKRMRTTILLERQDHELQLENAGGAGISQ
jgi:hypothetical protein